MYKENDQSQGGKLEWRLNVADGTSTTPEKLEPESCRRVNRICGRLRGLLMDVLVKIWMFLETVWNLGKNEPKKVIHCLKVGMALCLVSLFYYMRPLYDGVGGNAMWAVMTVVVVYEYTVGATLAKCVNRVVGTSLAGFLGIGVHWIANQSSEKMEPIILQGSVFLLAASATFSRFIPSVKARFDYGAMIFILTFSLVSVSGYRVDKLFELAKQRLSTIAIGTSICILTTMLFSPVWAGYELHSLICNNLEKLADSLDGVAECFKNGVGDAKEDAFSKKSQRYKCVLNSKATEESMANFARWEPTHGNFNFRHPWKEYLKVGASMRDCAYYVETLNGIINSNFEPPEFLKKHLGGICKKLSSSSSDILKELAIMMRTMTKSSRIGLVVEEMNFSVEDLQNALKSLPNQSVSSPEVTAADSCNDTEEGEPNTKPQIVPLMEIVPLVTAASLLIEIAAKVEGIVEATNHLASRAEFDDGDSQDNVKLMTLQKV
ncbi:hypothetical protein ACH5RR_000048 [Cinchona calisaya]|uniref:Aluminum-activated malate transporter n=1 Tax=Cinchona calisaya TaxID=153742 RepID=A0ABD3B0I1_9GENT